MFCGVRVVPVGLSLASFTEQAIFKTYNSSYQKCVRVKRKPHQVCRIPDLQFHATSHFFVNLCFTRTPTSISGLNYSLSCSTSGYSPVAINRAESVQICARQITEPQCSQPCWADSQRASKLQLDGYRVAPVLLTSDSIHLYSASQKKPRI